MNKAIFLDRDGTINIEKQYLHRIKDFEFLPRVIDALRLLQNAGYILIIITNQSGIGRGLYKEKDFKILNDWMIEELKKLGIIINGVYYCPHLPNAKIKKYRKICDCRKPSLGLYKRAITEHDINIIESWAIGDKLRDCAICDVESCKGFLIGDNEEKEIIEKIRVGDKNNIRYAIDLYEAAKMIIEETRK